MNSRELHLQPDSPDQLGVGYDDDGDGDGEAEGVDEDDVPHVGVQGRLGPNNATAELIKHHHREMSQAITPFDFFLTSQTFIIR